jgi:hypothetical protein
MINIKPQNVGKLHKALGVTKGTPIPAPKLNKALKSTDPSLKKEAVFAKNAKSFNHAGSGNKALDAVASGKPPKADMQALPTDRGVFKI